MALPASAKQAAMGGAAILPKHNDVGLLAHNPALLDSAMHGQAMVGYANYFANAHSINAAGAWSGGRWGSFGATIQELNYGAFDGYDEFGNSEGTFSANEIAIMAHWAHPFGTFFGVGITAKTMLSQLESYVSAGIAVDVACRYRSEDGLTNLALSLQNAGGQVKTYYEGSPRQRLPLSVQLAGAHKFRAAPFGISLSLNNLQQWNLYNTPANNNLLQTSGEVEDTKFARGVKELLCHLSVGLGIYPTDKIIIMAGYNYLRTHELKSAAQTFGSGFSVGAGLRIKHFELSYAWGMYHLAGGSHSVSLVVDIREIVGEKRIIDN
jgi:hypothetical protein